MPPGTKEKNPNRVKAGKRSKRKGNKNENVLAKLFKAWWGEGEWARTPMSGGWSSRAVREGFRTCGDVITTAENFPFCVEGKHQEGWELQQLLNAPKSLLYKFWAQTVDETPSGLIPLLVVHRNHKERLVITRESVFSGTFLESPHLVLRASHVGESLVIMLLSDFFKTDPTVYRRGPNVAVKAETETPSDVPEVQAGGPALPV